MDLDQIFISPYLVAFIMGLFSSMHCVGMCGSIVGTLTLSLKQEIRENKSVLFFYTFNYNFGRLTSYTIGGGLVGIVEFILTLPLGEDHSHRLLQLLSALVMASAGVYIAGWFPRFAYIEKSGSRLWKYLEPHGRRLIPVQTPSRAFLFGMIWGWLPCGLVYTAFALAATTGDIVKSALTMLAFGLGTLPAVFGIGIIGGIATRLSRMDRVKQAAGLFLIALAMLVAFPSLNTMR